MEQLSLFDSSPPVFTVSQINAYLRQKLEADFTLQELWLEGEISNWNKASSGHIYFTLKDEKAAIRCVIWRSQAERLRYLPGGDGEAVRGHGRISIYEAGGAYQFYVDELEPVGRGALYARFERLKTSLAAEGLFDESRKQPLPPFPHQIGLVTSATGAALRDILNVLRRRYPLGRVILSPSPVQGQTAPPQIIAALEAIARQPVDLIILARGGGSLEDLWAFNDESLARAIAACPVPIISGIGHEIDFTIADFVADLRAPTPSAAAELATPDQADLQRQIEQQQQKLNEAAYRLVNSARRQLQEQQHALERSAPQAQINAYRQQTDSLISQAKQRLQNRFQLQRANLRVLSSQLAALNPYAILSRGYAIIEKEGRIISQIEQVAAGDHIFVQLSDGRFEAIVGASQDAQGGSGGSPPEIPLSEELA